MYVSMARGRGKKVEGETSASSGGGRGRGKGVVTVAKVGGGVTRASKRNKKNLNVKDVDSKTVEKNATATIVSENGKCTITPRDQSASDEYAATVPPLSTTILYSTLGHQQARGVSESSSGSTVGTPAGSATPQSESADSSCDDSEQFSLASVLDKTRRVSSLSNTSSVVFNTSREEDSLLSVSTADLQYHIPSRKWVQRPPGKSKVDYVPVTISIV